MNSIRYEDDGLWVLDQRLVPQEEKWIQLHHLEDAAFAIKEMVVRGAPLIGFTAIFGMALWLKDQKVLSKESLKQATKALKDARPTAVNLAFEVDKIEKSILEYMGNGLDLKEMSSLVMGLGKREMEKLLFDNQKMASYALQELKNLYPQKKLKLMTHCNTGKLACGCLGTALGVIVRANEEGILEKVWVDETRPYLQGSRLTSFELIHEKIDHHIVVEGAASYLMARGLVDAIFVGADRIAANGDTANKIGTSTLAIVARYYNVPFYVVAPLSSFDYSISSGNEIEIELRNQSEILKYKEHYIAHKDAKALNPSFDVTTADLITAIISEKGIVRQPNIQSMKEFLV